MSEFSKKLRYLRQSKDYTQKHLANLIGVSESTIGMYERGQREPNFEVLETIADVFNVYMSELIEGQQLAAISPHNAVSIRYLGEIAASFDNLAVEEYDSLKIPIEWLHGRPASDYFAMTVKGDSMYPLYCDGDEILCLHVSSMDRSGQVGIYLHGEEATLKKIHYVMGEDWVELEPVNPQYAPKRIEGVDLEQSRVIGKVIKLIRNINE